MAKKLIKGFPNYKIDSGKVINTDTGREVKSYDNGQGYKQVKLWKNGKRYTKNVHRLIKGEPDCDVHHEDGNKGNNTSNNLKPISHRENIRKIFKS